MPHLSPHSQALFYEMNQMCTAETCNLSPYEPQIANLVCESVVHHLCAVHANPRTRFHTAVRATWMLRRTSVDKNTWRSAFMSAV